MFLSVKIMFILFLELAQVENLNLFNVHCGYLEGILYRLTPNIVSNLKTKII